MKLLRIILDLAGSRCSLPASNNSLVKRGTSADLSVLYGRMLNSKAHSKSDVIIDEDECREVEGANGLRIIIERKKKRVIICNK